MEEAEVAAVAAVGVAATGRRRPPRARCTGRSLDRTVAERPGSADCIHPALPARAGSAPQRAQQEPTLKRIQVLAAALAWSALLLLSGCGLANAPNRGNAPNAGNTPNRSAVGGPSLYRRPTGPPTWRGR